jgi:hypothetical protein
MIIDQAEHVIGIGESGIKTNTILEMPNGFLQRASAGLRDTVVKMLLNELLALRLGLEEIWLTERLRLGGRRVGEHHERQRQA